MDRLLGALSSSILRPLGSMPTWKEAPLPVGGTAVTNSESGGQRRLAHDVVETQRSVELLLEGVATGP